MGTPGPLWRHTTCYMLPALSASGHSSLGTQANQTSGLWQQSFFFFCFLKNFYFFKLIYFSWRISTLQHCDGFCHTSTWISLRYTCDPTSWTPHHLPPHPVPLALGALLHALNLCWSCFLYGNVHVSMLFSLSNHLTLTSHWVQKSVLYVGVSDQSQHFFFVFSAIWTGVYR